MSNSETEPLNKEKDGEPQKKSTSKKSEPFLMKKGDYTIHLLIEEVKNLWYDFILTLDKGFKKEIEAGMYQ